MGLDMYLEKVMEPEDIKSHSLFDETKSYANDYYVFDEDEYAKMPNTIKIACKPVSIIRRYYNFEQVVRDIYNIDEYQDFEVVNHGWSYGGGMAVMGIDIKDIEFEQNPFWNRETITLLNSKNLKLVVKIQNNNKYSLQVAFIEPEGGNIEKYKGKYITQKKENCFIVETAEVAYQRKGLTDEGWNLLPENCTYIDDFNVVKELCDKGGLSSTFIDNWVDGETVFYAYW